MAKPPVPILSLEITAMGGDGLAFGYTATGRKIAVENATVGDICDVKIVQRKRGISIGRAVHFHKYSPHRIAPVCAHFDLCGGCRWQFASYDQQLVWKQDFVRDSFRSLGFNDIEIAPVLPSPQVYFYRNKLEFSASDDRWLDIPELGQEVTSKNALGFHVPNRWSKIFQVNYCHLQTDPSNQIRQTVQQIAEAIELDFYNPVSQTGTLRNLIIRTTNTGQVMVIVQFYPRQLDKQEQLIEQFLQVCPTMHSLYTVQNDKGNDTFYDCDTVLRWGQPYIVEELHGLKFAITPKSFFQVNPAQAENLLTVIQKFAQLTNQEIVYDLYAGTGTISLILAKQAKQVLGIELVPDAVRDAHRNKELNNLDHVDFVAGDMKEMLQPATIAQYGKPHLIVTDPPRSGMHPQVIQQLLELDAPRLIYVSCNPVSQARDIQLLGAKYRITAMQPIDMFPQTAHVENVVLLER